MYLLPHTSPYPYICMYVRVYECMYVCTKVCIYDLILPHIHTYVCTYVCTNVCMYVRKYVRITSYCPISIKHSFRSPNSTSHLYTHSQHIHAYLIPNMYMCTNVCMYVMYVCTNECIYYLIHLTYIHTLAAHTRISHT